MHKVYENNDLMMYFKKRYCHVCGKALQKKRSERIIMKGDPEHKTYCTVGTTYKPYGNIMVIGKEYYCYCCEKTFTCDEQSKIIEAQKHYGKKIVTEQEIQNVQSNGLIVSMHNIKKARWLLLIPVVGGLVCSYGIFNGKLQIMTENRDGAKLLFASVAAVVLIALVMKLLLAIFSGNEFVAQYSNLLMIMPATFAFNFPVLWYINHKVLLQ